MYNMLQILMKIKFKSLSQDIEMFNWTCTFLHYNPTGTCRYGIIQMYVYLRDIKIHINASKKVFLEYNVIHTLYIYIPGQHCMF